MRFLLCGGRLAVVCDLPKQRRPSWWPAFAGEPPGLRLRFGRMFGVAAGLIPDAAVVRQALSEAGKSAPWEQVRAKAGL